MAQEGYSDSYHTYQGTDGKFYQNETDASNYGAAHKNDSPSSPSSSSSSVSKVSDDIYKSKQSDSGLSSHTGSALTSMGDESRLMSLYEAGKWQEMANFKYSNHFPTYTTSLLKAIGCAKTGDYITALQFSDYGVPHNDNAKELKLRAVAFQEAVQSWEKAKGREMTKADLVKELEAKIYEWTVNVFNQTSIGLKDKITWRTLLGREMSSKDESRILKGNKGLFGKPLPFPFPDLEKIPARSVLPNPQAGNLVNEGLAAYNAKDYAKAVELWQKAADMGHPVAMCNLGNAYINGQGVTKDSAKAAEWYEKAANLGHAMAMNGLGNRYLNGDGKPKDQAKAAEWFEKAANLGNVEAMNNLGYRYLSGTGKPKDEAKAVELFRKAIDAGNNNAIDSLGECYRDGTGVKQDFAKAEQLFKEAISKGIKSEPNLEKLKQMRGK